jgi:hypothetical protein
MNALTITDTDIILAEYVLLPIQDLHQNFLFKILEPVELGWQHGKVSLFKIMVDKTSLLNEIERTVAQTFSFMAEDALDINEGTLPEPMNKWLYPLQVQLRECHIVPKE